MSSTKRRFAWLRPPVMPEDGMMSLTDHLRELRYRVLVSVAAILLAAIAAMFVWRWLFSALMYPYERAIVMLQARNPDIHTTAVNSGFVAPFTLWLKTCFTAGLLLTSPLWIYQIWAFIVPALVEKEKKYAYRYLGVAVPLFLFGVFCGWFVLPQGIEAMLMFTPAGENITNLVDLNYFFDLTLKTMGLFGLSFLIPILLIALNGAGVVSGEQLGKVRPYALFLCFGLTAAITPSTDPFTMLVMGVPLCLL
ncbi:MAG: twin-arginine translocase subunit TatC, partial [Propionibacteriaceae bacterium]